jgi:ATP-binding cassette subfamily B protein RaxB
MNLAELDGTAFPIRIGETVTVIGPSRPGKTSLIDVLLSVITPTEGEISIYD